MSACEQFSLYVFGGQFQLETDHKPLEYIYAPRSKPSARIERWVLRLQAFDFTVVHRPGRSNIADALSRLKRPLSTDVGDQLDMVCEIVRSSVPGSLTATEIEEACATDPELSAVRRCILSGDWTSCPNQAFLHVKNELCVCGHIVLRGDRIVVPKALQLRVVALAHEGHQGVTKTKARLRTKVWWPRMDAVAEKVCKQCHECQVVEGTQPAPTPMLRTRLPTQAWQDCSADLLGPLPSGESILVIVDYYSRYFETVILRSVTTAKIIGGLKPIFARWGMPCSLRTDNGPQFVSDEFQQFLRENGIEHRSIPPYWPQANGEVERQNRSLLKALRIAALKGTPWQEELLRFLTAYRSTPHSTTGRSPYEMMCNRRMRTKLPTLPAASLDEAVRDADWSRKLSDKTFRDSVCRSRPSAVSVGDAVLVRTTDRANKLTPPYQPEPATVVARKGNEVEVQRADGSVLRRHSSHVKPYVDPGTTAISQEGPAPGASEPTGRPHRERRTPTYLGDYVV